MLAIEETASGPLPYLAVASRWSETILDSPPLWSTIVIEDGEDEVARVHTFLHLSANHLIDVRLHIENDHPYQSELLGAVFLQCRERIRSFINLTANSDRRPEVMSSVLAACPYPAMEILQCSWVTVSELRRMFNSCSNLRQYIPAIPLMLERFLSQEVEVLHVIGAQPTPTSSLQQRNKLRQLTIEYQTTESHVNWTGKEHTERCVNHFRTIIAGLGATLTHLRLRLPLIDLFIFAPLLGSFPRLQVMHFMADVGLKLDSIPLLDNFSRIADLPPLIHVTLAIEGYPGVSWDRKHAFPSQPIMLLHVLGILQSLPSFELSASGRVSFLPKPLAQLLHFLENVRTLKIVGVNIHWSPEDDTEIRMASMVPVEMKHLRYLSLGFLSILEFIKANQLISLDLADSYYIPPHVLPGPLLLPAESRQHMLYLRAHDTVFELLNQGEPLDDSPKWPQLRRIVFTSGRPTSISLLNSIQIAEFQGQDRYSVTGLLSKLLFEPRACPHLHTIILGFIPLWDPLFEVLRRRNINSVPCLQVLSLPVLPVYSLLSILVRLLQGQACVYTSQSIDEMIDQRGRDRTL